MRGSCLLAVAVALALTLSPAAGAQQPGRSAPAGGQKASPPQPTLPRGDVERGRYIVENVAMCVECHSGRDRAGNIDDSRRYYGAQIPFAPPWPNDWAMRAPRNAGLPGYTDAMALRLLTQGSIGRDGTQLRPPMPRYRMNVQDAADVIAFMRSLL